MKKSSLIFLFSCLSMLSLSQANAHSHHNVYVVETAPAPVYVVQPSAPIVNVIEVQSEPPADLVEQMDPSPGPDFVWVGGRWNWNNQWNWSKGSWVRRPHTAAVWVPGHWRKSHHDHRWVWEEGSWR